MFCWAESPTYILNTDSEFGLGLISFVRVYTANVKNYVWKFKLSDDLCFNEHMKVSYINTYKAPNFKSQNPDNEFVIGYDDEISKLRREYIREHYYNNVMPYQSIYEREKRLDEFELNKLIGSLLGKKVNTRVITVEGGGKTA